MDCLIKGLLIKQHDMKGSSDLKMINPIIKIPSAEGIFISGYP